jgi:hypothetical protein
MNELNPYESTATQPSERLTRRRAGYVTTLGLVLLSLGVAYFLMVYVVPRFYAAKAVTPQLAFAASISDACVRSWWLLILPVAVAMAAFEFGVRTKRKSVIRKTGLLAFGFPIVAYAAFVVWACADVVLHHGWP